MARRTSPLTEAPANRGAHRQARERRPGRELHVFEGGGIIFGGEEVIAFFEAEPFADVFKGIGVSPADADGFFGESEDALFGFVEWIFGVNPGDLVLREVTG